MFSYRCVAIAAVAACCAPIAAQRPAAPTFYRDVLPILQAHCQSCHRAGEIAPMPLTTYSEAKPYAAKMKRMVGTRQMPPWFADPRFGHFSNDPSLSNKQIAAIVAWADAGAPAGDPRDAPPPRQWTKGWNIAPPDAVVTMPKPVHLPARGMVPYTYEIIPTGFTQDRWVQMAEVRPSSRANVHHAVVYIRPPDSKWLPHAPVGVPFVAGDLPDPQERAEAHGTTADMLLVYAPGSEPDRWADGMAKFIPAGSDLVVQMHYTTNGKEAVDRTSIGMVFAKQPPRQRVVTLQLTNHSFLIPPYADNFRVEAHGTIPNDCLLLNFFPHMHLRGKAFEYRLRRGGGSDTLLHVNYHFHWQLSYKLATPLPLKAGDELHAIAWFDNSAGNAHNPDPSKLVQWGDQTSDEMMVGFFDVAIPAQMDKWQFFVRAKWGEKK